jgi:hypothetical protein
MPYSGLAFYEVRSLRYRHPFIHMSGVLEPVSDDMVTSQGCYRGTLPAPELTCLIL